MALINASSYSNLEGVSSNIIQKQPGKFFNVFITGKRRDGQQPGTYQCQAGFGGDYFVNNANEVYFIPLFIKRYWTKYQKAQNQQGETYDRLVGFGWKDGDNKPDSSCKYEYIIAGYLWDNENKAIVKHNKDLPDNDIKEGDNVLIYFRCKGIKCSSAFDFLSRCNDKAKGLVPLSDNPRFEQVVINPRRFLVKAGITSKDTQFGSTDSFDFYPTVVLSDDMVKKILEQADKLVKDFDYQFDKTDVVQMGNQQDADDTVFSDDPQKISTTNNTANTTITVPYNSHQDSEVVDTVTSNDVVDNLDLDF